MNLSTKITAFLIEQNVVSKKNKEVYEYGWFRQDLCAKLFAGSG